MTNDFDLQPTLRGDRLLLRPLTPADQEPLWAVAQDPLIWEQHPDKTRFERAGFLRFFQGALASGSAFAVIDQHSGRIIGASSYYEWDAAKAEVAIGYTFLERAAWGGAINGELKRLMIEHAARWAKAIWFHVGAENWRSRRAMEKISAEAVFEGPRPLHGVMVNFIYYRIKP